MTQGSSGYCTKCGARLAPDSRFCTKCGAARWQEPAALAPIAASASQAYGTVVQAAGLAGMAASLPWQTIEAGETPDLREMLSRVAMPGARTLVQRSLKRTGLAMGVTALLDLGVAGLTGGGSAVAAALPRALAGAATAILSLITGSRGGALRRVTGIVSLLTALVQLVSLGVALVGGVRAGMPILSMLSTVVAVASAFTMAIKTASAALRRRS